MEVGRTGTQRGAGYVLFAATLFMILGVFNVVDGIVALAEDDHFVSDELFFGDLIFWGVILLLIGGLQLLASFRLFDGRGQMLGIFLASFNMFAQLLFIGAYPIWSVIIIVIDGIVIYGLTVYGEHFD